MLPFMKKRLEGSVSAPSEKIVRESDNEYDEISLHTAAEDVMAAIRSNDVNKLSDALKAFCDLRDAMPHLEGGR